MSDTSIHLCLPAAQGQQLPKLGWAEPHQYEDFGTEFMVYGPRDEAELETILSIIEEHRFRAGRKFSGVTAVKFVDYDASCARMSHA